MERRRRGCFRTIFTIWLLTTALIVAFLTGVAVGRNTEAVSGLVSPQSWQSVATIASRAVTDAVSEQPRFSPNRDGSPMPFCRDVEQGDAVEIADALALMRGTPEGNRLFHVLLDHRVCIGVENIPFNSGYAYAIRTADGSWSNSHIMVDTEHVRSNQTDVLAALLVHEATHIDRAITGETCAFSGTCTRLDNGVDLEEEIAAHAAEAEWWIAAYGESGKRLAFGYDYGMNRLAKAYQDGPDAFAAYVTDLRDDPREGEAVEGSRSRAVEE